MARLRYNGLSATLGADLLTAGTTVTFSAALTHAAGAVPTITGSDYIPLAILDAGGAVVEIVHLTAYTTGTTTGTVTRAQESTTAAARATGSSVIHGPTVADMSSSSSDGLTQLRKSTDQTLPNGTWTMVTWDIEDQDTYGLHESVTNPSRVTFVEAGVYLLNFNCGVGASTVNDRYAAFYKNGVEMPGRVTGKGQNYTELVLSKIVSVAAGDYIQAAAYQDAGGALTLFASTPITNMLTIRKLGVL